MATPLFTIDKAVLLRLVACADDASASEFVLNVEADGLRAVVADPNGHAAFETRVATPCTAKAVLGIKAEKLARVAKSLKTGPVAVSADGARIVFSQPGRSLHIGNIVADYIPTPKFPDRVALTTTLTFPDASLLADFSRTAALDGGDRVVLKAADGMAIFTCTGDVDGLRFDIPCTIEGPAARSGYKFDWLKSAFRDIHDGGTMRFGADHPLLVESSHGRTMIAPYVAADGEDDGG